jgi:type I restriction enzyme, S subunit
MRKLGDLFHFVNGRGFKKTEWKESGLPIIRIQNLNSRDAQFNYYKGAYDKKIEINNGDLLFSWSGTIGTSFGPHVWNRKIGLLNQHIFKLEFKVDIDRDYAYYALKFITEEIEKKVNGAVGLVHITKEKLNQFEIPLPPLPEQQRIVAILDEAFAAIAKAKANAEQNLKNAKELFESYLQGVFENSKDNWDKKKWGDLCDFVRGPFGGSLKKNIFKEDGYVVYEQKHAIHDHFYQLRYFIDEDKFNEMIRFELKPGDIIMSCSGVTLGRVAIVPNGIKRGIINQALLKLTPKKNVSVHFLKHWLRSRIFQKIIFDYSGGAAIPNVPSAKILKNVLIPFPTLIEQEKVVNEIELVSAQTKKLEAIYQQKINDLEELKKSILQKAFSGELKTAEMLAV